MTVRQHGCFIEVRVIVCMFLAVLHLFMSYQKITGCLISALLVHYFINIFPVTGCTFFTAVRNTWKYFNMMGLFCVESGDWIKV